MNLYHVTTETAASSILAGGFRDGEGTYLTTELLRGVWLTDDPIAIHTSGAAWGRGGPLDTYLRVRLDVEEDAVAQFEFVNEGFDGPAIIGVNYREWLVPADWLNPHTTTIDIVLDDFDDKFRSVLALERKPIPPLPPVEGEGRC